MGVGKMGPTRITTNVAPIGGWRVARHSAPPGHRLASRGEHGFDAGAERVAREGRQEFLIGGDRVAFERDRIGLGDRQIAKRDAARRLRHARRRIKVALEEDEGLRQARHMPRRLRAARLLAHTQAHAAEHPRRIEPALMHHFRKRLGVRTVIAGRRRGDRAGRCVEGDKRPLLGLDQRQTACERLARGREGIGARRIQNDETRLQRNISQRAGEISDAQRLQRHAGIARNDGFDRCEIILARILQPVARQINESDRIRTGSRSLVEEIPERASQPILIQVAGADHLEPRLREGLRHQPGIIGGRGETAGLIGRIPDDQSNARFGRLRMGDGKTGERDDHGGQHAKELRHETDSRRKVSPYILSHSA